MAQVFISYAKKDHAAAQLLAQRLIARGFEVWWDFQLYTGDDFHDVIREEIHKATAVIVIWSESAVASQWVRGEAQEASDLNKLITTHLPEFDTKRVPLNFRALHTESVEKFDAIVRAIERKGARSHVSTSVKLPLAERSGSSGMEPSEIEDLYRKAEAFRYGRKPEEAARIFRMLAKHGHPDSQISLGRMIEGVDGRIPGDPMEAARLYKSAGDNGSPSGYMLLGHMYKVGSGVPRDPVEAFRLYMLAANAGNGYGAYYAAEMLESGEGRTRTSMTR
jgi:hypothetical protein